MSAERDRSDWAGWIPFSVLAVLFLVFFYPLLLGGQTLFFRDILNFAYPMKHYLWESFSRGELPLWWPAVFSGVPFLALMHTGVFYPFSLLFFLNDFQTAFDLYFVLQYLLLVFSVYALVRFWGLSRGAALASGTVALLGGYFLTVVTFYNHFQSAVWLPLILLGFHKFIVTGRPGHFALTLAASVAQTLGGSPEISLLTAGVLGCYALFCITGPCRIATRRSRFFFLLLFWGFTLGLCAPQLLPTHRLMEHIARAGGVRYDLAAQWSLSPEKLSYLFLPPDFRDFLVLPGPGTNFFLQSVYMGLVPLFFFLWGLLRLNDPRGRFWIGVFAVGIFLGLGENNPAYRVFYEWVPFFNLFRYPEKFFFLSAFALVFLTGLGVESLSGEKEKGDPSAPRRILGVGLVLLLAVAGTRILFPDRPAFLAIMILLLMTGCACARAVGILRRPVWVAIVVALAVLDLFARNVPLMPLISARFYQVPPEVLKQVNGGGADYRVYSGPLESEARIPTKNQFPSARNLLLSHLAVRDYLYSNLGSIYGVNYVDGVTGVHLKNAKVWSVEFVKPPLERRKRILERSNVKFWIPPQDAIPPAPEHPMEIRPVEVLADALPRAFLVGRARAVSDDRAWAIYWDAGFDPLSEVLLPEGTDTARGSAGEFAGRVREMRAAGNRVALEVEAEGKGWLVLLDAYFPGWSATVDGNPQSILQANRFYRAVAIEPGTHRVEFSFTPEGLAEGLQVFGLTLGLAGTLLGVPRIFQYLVDFKGDKDL